MFPQKVGGHEKSLDNAENWFMLGWIIVFLMYVKFVWLSAETKKDETTKPANRRESKGPSKAVSGFSHYLWHWSGDCVKVMQRFEGDMKIVTRENWVKFGQNPWYFKGESKLLDSSTS